MSSDNRQCLRVPVSGINRPAVLRLKGKSVTGELLNESSGGYGLALPLSHLKTFSPGRIVVMDVNDLVVKVRVVHVKEEDGYLSLGLERIEELEDKLAAKRDQYSWLTTFRCSAGESTGGSANLTRDVSIALVLASTLLVGLFFPSLSEFFQGSKTRGRTTSSSLFVLPWMNAKPSTPLSSAVSFPTRAAKPSTYAPQPPKNAAHAAEIDNRLSRLRSE